MPAAAQIDGGPPLYCWVVVVNKQIPVYDFQLCYECLDRPSQQRVRDLTARGATNEALTCLVGRLIPHIIMSQRNAPPGTWRIEGNEEGKKPRLIAPTMEKQLGYSTAREDQLVTLAMALGREDRVAQVGCDVRRIHLSKHVPLEMFLESISHKLCDPERLALEAGADGDRERVVGRIFILWTLKEALMKAIGQPLRSGFDWRRVCFDVENEHVYMDGKPITGWEFKLFVARVPFSGKMKNKTYKYQAACAIHRGGTGNRFTWNQRGEAMDEWLRFMDMDVIMERVWSLDYPHIQQARAMRPREAAAAQASLEELPGLSGSIPPPRQWPPPPPPLSQSRDRDPPIIPIIPAPPPPAPPVIPRATSSYSSRPISKPSR